MIVDQITDIALSVANLSILAGSAILETYSQSDFQIERKTDDSPLTLADRRSHDIITNSLAALTSEIPILSEEGAELSYDERAGWDEFWLVDPLDGTKEFIKRNGEFTVNIALIQNGTPVMGVVHAPVLKTVYAGIVASKSDDGAGPPGVRCGT